MIKLTDVQLGIMMGLTALAGMLFGILISRAQRRKPYQCGEPLESTGSADSPTEDWLSPPFGRPTIAEPCACTIKGCGRMHDGDAEYCAWCGRWICPEHRTVTTGGHYKCSECCQADEQVPVH